MGEKGGVANTLQSGMNLKCGVYNPQSLVEKKDMTFCNNGWTLMDANNQPPSCCTRLLKTLDLFPLTTIKTKED
ncbi:unnamed protein product [Lupinus luteus]|uniref:Uncharacterized protein n=1 Tax=Lupinus luteus TaxID=3873 RepID=A0AAV1W650_LUPLU